MAIVFEYERCGKTLRVADETAGNKGKCPHCMAVIAVPDDFLVLVEVLEDESDETVNVLGEDAEDLRNETKTEEVGSAWMDSLNEQAEVFKMLSDETRLGILCSLAGGPKNVGTLCDTLDLPQPTVSHHLSLMRATRLVRSERQGKQMVYSTCLDQVSRSVGILQFILGSR